ncbi:two-component response regulator [Pseudomonas aeruginosa]|nr:two-component response regulator [Pseudomonas aeruginosa]
MEQEAWRILIVEDDRRLAELTREYLEGNGLKVDIEANAHWRRRVSSPNARTWWCST